MRLSTTTEYAIRILNFMSHDEKAIFSANKIHQQLDLPYKYTTRLLTLLAKKKYIKVTRGRNGGFQLAKPLKKISIMDIIVAVESDVDFNRCVLGFNDCSSENPCAMHSIWKDHIKEMKKTFSDMTLHNLKLAKATKI